MLPVRVGGMHSDLTQHFRFHVAPLQGYTNHHFRYFLRTLSPDAVLWSEMLKPLELFEASPRRQEQLLTRGKEGTISNFECPCVLQLGDDDADRLAAVSILGLRHGYTQLDLNVGCPSTKMNAGFGCSLMRDGGDTVAGLVERMSKVTKGNVPISVKCRIGVQESSSTAYIDEYQSLRRFVERIVGSGNVKEVVVHARRGILGLSPSKNRLAPPLRTVNENINSSFQHANN